MNGEELLFGKGAIWYREATPWVRDATLLNLIVRKIKASYKHGTCVEVGAGGCDIAVAAQARRIGPWVCVDKSFSMLSSARRSAGFRIQADGGTLPLNDAVANVIACRSVLHYLGAKATLPEWRRVLARGGLIVVAQK